MTDSQPRERVHFPPLERVKLLLVEHKTLRDEIIARTGHGYQMLSFGATSIAVLVTLVLARNSDPGLLTIVLIGVLVLLLVFALWTGFRWSARDIRKAAARLRQIEIDINDRVGEDILVWENLSGAAVTGWWGKSVAFDRSKLADLPEPERTFKGKPITS